MAVRAIRPTDKTPTSTTVLDRAAEQLRSSLRSVSASVGSQGLEALEGLDAVVAMVRAALTGSVDLDGAAASGYSSRDARLLMALRVAVLQIEPVEEAAHASLEVLRAIEAVLDRVLGLEERGLASRLAQPDALQLLVEVAHDLRSPLTSILFLSETLRIGHSGAVNDVQRSQLGLIYSAALNLASLTSNVVDLARAGHDLVHGEPELYSISEMLGGVREMVQPMAEEKGVELRLSPSEYDRAFGHPAAVSRVLLNLTTNGLKFTEEGWVEVGARHLSSSRVEFFVRDTGRGISPERQTELFSPFMRRAYSPGRFFSGSGLGLSIARRILRAMGSELEMETAPGWGTRFHFVLTVPVPR